MYWFTPPFPVYGMDWSSLPEIPFRLAASSFIRNSENKVAVIDFNEKTSSFSVLAEAVHPYPATKIQWGPKKMGQKSAELFATSSDFLRLWEVKEGKLSSKAILSNKKGDTASAPLTSFDWNTKNCHLIGTCSVDTTCTIWDVETLQMRTQLIAHDKEVFDIAWSNRPEVFATAGADGSIRMFDLRHLEHSTIIYETGPPDSPTTPPLLRLCWNQEEANYLAAISLDSHDVIVLDTRMPSRAMVELTGHKENINAIQWKPKSTGKLASVSDDGTPFVWDVGKLPAKKYTPPPYKDKIEKEGTGGSKAIVQVAWNKTHEDWMGISCSSSSPPSPSPSPSSSSSSSSSFLPSSPLSSSPNGSIYLFKA